MHPVVRSLDPLASDAITVFFFLFVVVMAAIHRSAPRKLRVLAGAALRMRMGRQTLRDEMDLQDRNFVGLLVLALASITLFMWQALHITHAIAPQPYMQLFGLATIIVIGLGLITRTAALLVRSDPGASEYMYTGTLLFTLLGLLLFPVTILIAYHHPWRAGLVTTGSVLAMACLLYRWLRGTWIGMGEGVPLRYIVLYICAAEVVPLLMLVRSLRPPIHTASNL